MTGRRVLPLAMLLTVAATAWGQLSIIPTSLPSTPFPVGQVFPAQQLSVPVEFEEDILTWSISAGNLPPGLVLSRVGAPPGSITGTPTQAGAYPFTAMVVDGSGPVPTQATRQYTLYISLGTPLSLTPLTHAQAAVGSFYSSPTFQAGGGVPGYSWSLQSGTNTDGLVINASTGQLTGAPIAGGVFAIAVALTDASGAQTSANFNLNVLGITTATLPNGMLGTAYSQTLVAAGATGTLTWSLSGTPPPGLTISPQGVLSGTPTASGSFPFVVQVSDIVAKLTTTKAFNISISGPTLTITTTSLPGGTVGTAYSQTLAATGSTNPLTWSLSGTAPLPAGLNISTQGVISGSPTLAGTFPFQVQVTDALANLSAVQELSITISAAVTITPATLPNGVVNIPYTATTLTVTGVTISNWAVTVGTLPAGLNLNASTGVVSGTPTAAGSSTFSVSATPETRAQVGTPVIQAYTIVISAAPSVTISVPSIGVAATQPSATVTLSGTYPLDITGTMTLSFSPISGIPQNSYDAKFGTGGTTAQFTIPAGSTSASVPVIIGTVAGTITINTTTSLASTPIVSTIPVNSTVPVITGVTPGAATSGAFSISVTGRSTPRNMTSALFHFTSPTGTTPASADITVPLTSAFTTWYGSSASFPFGSTFTMTVQFSFTGPAGLTVPYTTVTVTLTNSVGASNTSSPASP
jgi:large repetitive protein